MDCGMSKALLETLDRYLLDGCYSRSFCPWFLILHENLGCWARAVGPSYGCAHNVQSEFLTSHKVDQGHHMTRKFCWDDVLRTREQTLRTMKPGLWKQKSIDFSGNPGSKKHLLPFERGLMKAWVRVAVIDEQRLESYKKADLVKYLMWDRTINLGMMTTF